MILNELRVDKDKKNVGHPEKTARLRYFWLVKVDELLALKHR